jgi:protoheme IX farnesyltransferase
MSDARGTLVLPASAGVRATVSAIVELTKPSLATLVMVTAFAGAVVAGGPLPIGRLVVALVATALVVGAANALNMVAEADADGLMARTRKRPLPSGRLSSEVALGFGVLSASFGLNVLGLAAGGLACGLALLAFASYVFVYTPLKRITPLALWVGALPGALPPLIGYAAARGSLGAPAWWLFAILFLWQVPHFIAISIFREADYRRAGMAVFSVARGAEAAERGVRLYSALLAVLALLPAAFGVVRVGYLAAVAPASVAFALLALLGPRGATRERWARRVFFASMPYLIVVCSAFVATS